MARVNVELQTKGQKGVLKPPKGKALTTFQAEFQESGDLLSAAGGVEGSCS